MDYGRRAKDAAVQAAVSILLVHAVDSWFNLPPAAQRLRGDAARRATPTRRIALRAVVFVHSRTERSDHGKRCEASRKHAPAASSCLSLQ